MSVERVSYYVRQCSSKKSFFYEFYANKLLEKRFESATRNAFSLNSTAYLKFFLWGDVPVTLIFVGNWVTLLDRLNRSQLSIMYHVTDDP